MQCANCNAQNPDDAKFCLECGAALARKCSRCGASNPPSAKFCGECGSRLPVVASVSRTPYQATRDRLPATQDRLLMTAAVHNGTPASASGADLHPPRFSAALSAPISMTVPNTVSISAGERKTLHRAFRRYQRFDRADGGYRSRRSAGADRPRAPPDDRGRAALRRLHRAIDRRRRLRGLWRARRP